MLLFVSPWVFAFAADAAVAWNAWIIGAIMAVDAAMAYLLVPVAVKSARRRTAH